MKIERLNENQIRCTLNKSDLASRQLKINELAYGSDKAKELFRDMMQQASYELGFEAEDTPLMIEAIPVSLLSVLSSLSQRLIIRKNLIQDFHASHHLIRMMIILILMILKQ